VLGSLKTNTKTVDNMMQVKPTNNSTWANIGISNLKTYNALNSGKTERFGRCLACEGFSVDLTC
jgi:hypothetical protein